MRRLTWTWLKCPIRLWSRIRYRSLSLPASGLVDLSRWQRYGIGFNSTATNSKAFAVVELFLLTGGHRLIQEFDADFIIALPDHPALPTKLRPSCQMQCDCIRSLPRDRRSEITWRRFPRRGFCAALPVRSDFRSEIDDAAAEHGASESEANRQKKLAEHSSVRSCYDLPEWHALCLLAGQPWHQRRRGGTLPGGSSQELSQRESPRPQTVEWRCDVRLNGTR